MATPRTTTPGDLAITIPAVATGPVSDERLHTTAFIALLGTGSTHLGTWSARLGEPPFSPAIEAAIRHTTSTGTLNRTQAGIIIKDPALTTQMPSRHGMSDQAPVLSRIAWDLVKGVPSRDLAYLHDAALATYLDANDTRGNAISDVLDHYPDGDIRILGACDATLPALLAGGLIHARHITELRHQVATGPASEDAAIQRYARGETLTHHTTDPAFSRALAGYFQKADIFLARALRARLHLGVPPCLMSSEHLPAYLCGQFDPQARGVFTTHLAECTTCQVVGLYYRLLAQVAFSPWSATPEITTYRALRLR